MPWLHPAFPVAVFLLGACVGSFLNVVIHRVPRGLSVNDPKRSFCPACGANLPWWQNLPLITWLVQRGKCATCRAPIPFRYFAVELLTAGFWLAAWLVFPVPESLIVIVFGSILISIAVIDAEHQVIPINFTSWGSLFALAVAFFMPLTLHLDGVAIVTTPFRSAFTASLGWVAGFGSLWAVVYFGKLVFGVRRLNFDHPVPWSLREPRTEVDQLVFQLGEEEIPWGEMFFRGGDVLEIGGHGILLDGKRTRATAVRIFAEEIEIDGRKISLENLHSLSGKAVRVRIPREAMGSGDPHLLGMLGAFLGAPSVFFIILASSLYAIAAAVITRIGFGRPLPYGPFLALGAVTWLFGGWQLWRAYFEFLQRGF